MFTKGGQTRMSGYPFSDASKDVVHRMILLDTLMYSWMRNLRLLLNLLSLFFILRLILMIGWWFLIMSRILRYSFRLDRIWDPESPAWFLEFPGCAAECVLDGHGNTIPSSSWSSCSWGFISPMASFLIALLDDSSNPTTSSTCSPWEPLDSSNVTSHAISTQPEVLLKTR